MGKGIVDDNVQKAGRCIAEHDVADVDQWGQGNDQKTDDQLGLDAIEIVKDFSLQLLFCHIIYVHDIAIFVRFTQAFSAIIAGRLNRALAGLPGAKLRQGLAYKLRIA